MITQCLHTAILVSDLKAAEEFYSKVLGLEKIDRQLKYPGIWYQIGAYQLHLILHQNLQIELQNKEKWGRNYHIAFAVSSLEESKKNLEKYGYGLQMSASGRAALFTKDPDGNIIEISQIN